MQMMQCLQTYIKQSDEQTHVLEVIAAEWAVYIDTNTQLLPPMHGLIFYSVLIKKSTSELPPSQLLKALAVVSSARYALLLTNFHFYVVYIASTLIPIDI